MSEMIEMIGKVRLNKQWYRGDDRYSDGDTAEEQLLSIVENHTAEEFNDIIMREGTWPVLYHLSPFRENIISWYPFRKGATVLELGAGCGAVTGALLNRGLQVCAVDLSLRRSRINAMRHIDSEELEICVGAMEDVLGQLDRKFDYVLLIGVLEYAAMFSDAENPQRHMLECIKSVMKPDAELFVAIENKVGLKYLAGCREDHTGRFYEGIEGYPHHDGPVTFSKKELEDLFDSCGFDREFFYPYPDYKFPVKVFTDGMQPERGELTRNWQHFDANRVNIFDESLASDVMIDAGLMGDLFNSFLVRLTMPGQETRERVRFVKSSMERIPAYRHHTVILECDGKTIVRKKAATKSAEAHLAHMRECRDQLMEGLRPGTSIAIAPCCLNTDGTIDFEYYTQKTLRNLLSDLSGEPQAFLEAVLRFRDALCASFGTVPFKTTEAFRAFFTDIILEEGQDALGVTNLDLNFDNVFIEGDGYIIVDYEWIVPFPVPLSFVLYRALLVNLDMASFPEEARDMVWNGLGIDEALRKTFWEMELRFQHFVSGKNNKLELFHNKEYDKSFSSINLELLLSYRDKYKENEKALEEYRKAMEESGKAIQIYKNANDELWKRVTIAEKNLEETIAELRRCTPLWRKALKWIRRR